MNVFQTPAKMVQTVPIRPTVTTAIAQQVTLEGIAIGFCIFTPPSGRGLVIPIFFPWFFFGGHLPQTSGFRSAKEIPVVSFATQPRAFILSDRNIFYTPGRGGGGEQRRGLMPLGLTLFFGGHLPQTSGFRSAKEILVVSFAAQPRAFILSDRNIFYTPPRGGEQWRGLMPLGLFLFFINLRSGREVTNE